MINRVVLVGRLTRDPERRNKNSDNRSVINYEFYRFQKMTQNFFQIENSHQFCIQKVENNFVS